MATRKDNGEGSISPYKKGGKIVGYRASIQIGRDVNGKIIRKEFYGKTKKEAKEKLQSFKKEYLLGNININNITLGEWFYTYIEDYQKKNRKFNTYRQYESVYRVHIKGTFLDNIKLKDLKAAHLNKFYNLLLQNGVTNTRIISINARIKTCLNEAEKQELIIKNYAKMVTLPKKDEAKKEVDVLTQQDQIKLTTYLDTLDDNRALAIQFDLGTGLRIGELLALKWDDISFAESKVSVNKNLQYFKDETGRWIFVIQEPKNASSIRVVPIPKELLKKLKAYKVKQLEHKLKIGNDFKNDGYIFLTNLGEFYHKASVSYFFNSVLKKLNINHIKIHALRHTYASRLFEAGVSPKTIQALMGHSSINTTMNIYTHVNEKQKEDAVEKLNDFF